MPSWSHRWEILFTELSAYLPAQSHANACLHLVTQARVCNFQDWKVLSNIYLSLQLNLPISMLWHVERGNAVVTVLTGLPGYLVQMSSHCGIWNGNILKTDLSFEKTSVVNRNIVISYSKCVLGMIYSKRERDVNVNAEIEAEELNCISVLMELPWWWNEETQLPCF